VYMAKDTELRRRVALKFVQEQDDRAESSHRRLLREARAAAALDHPFITKIYDTGRINGKTFIAMEYLEGQTLKQKLGKGRLEMKEALQIASEIGEALETAHEKGIVHRDLKPSNVMLTPQGACKGDGLRAGEGSSQVKQPRQPGRHSQRPYQTRHDSRNAALYVPRTDPGRRG
jgi:serine/threonine protein kinase